MSAAKGYYTAETVTIGEAKINTLRLTSDGRLMVDTSGSSGGGTAAAAPADNASPTVTGVGAFISGFDGTNWDRIRAGVTAAGTPTGYVNTLPGVQYLTSPLTLTNGQVMPAQSDVNGNLKNVEQYMPVYEDNAIGVAKVEHRYTNSRVTASGATNAIKSGAGLIHSISVDKWVTGLVIDVYDALTVTGTPIRKITLSATDTGPIPASVLDITFSTGLTVNLSAAADVGISYR